GRFRDGWRSGADYGKFPEGWIGIRMGFLVWRRLSYSRLLAERFGTSTVWCNMGRYHGESCFAPVFGLGMSFCGRPGCGGKEVFSAVVYQFLHGIRGWEYGTI